MKRLAENVTVSLVCCIFGALLASRAVLGGKAPSDRPSQEWTPLPLGSRTVLKSLSCDAMGVLNGEGKSLLW